MSNQERAEDARDAARKIGDTLYEKQLAYGDSGAIALGLWQARLRQYLTPDGKHYQIPVELIAHLPRITRLDDRINRIISNPAGDRLGEDPWLDAAGDCIIGAIAPRITGHLLGVHPSPLVQPVDSQLEARAREMMTRASLVPDALELAGAPPVRTGPEPEIIELADVHVAEHCSKESQAHRNVGLCGEPADDGPNVPRMFCNRKLGHYGNHAINDINYKVLLEWPRQSVAFCLDEKEVDIGTGPQVLQCDLPLGHLIGRHRRLLGNTTVSWDDAGDLSVHKTRDEHVSPLEYTQPDPVT